MKRERVDGKAADRNLSLLVSSISDYAIFMLDPFGHIVTWNAGAQALKGYTFDEIRGHSFERFYTPEDRESGLPAHLLGIARRDGRVENEGWRVRKDGSRFWADVVITSFYDEAGKMAGFGKVTRDLTQRRNDELRLAASERRFRTLVSSIKDYAIFMLDPDGIVSTWNDGAERLKGYTRDEVVGHSFERFYTSEDRTRGLPYQLLDLARRDGRVESEGWRVRKDGTRFWADVVITELQDDHGQLLGYSKVTRDLTERRAAEEQRERLIRELASSNRELEAFAYSVSHDLRAPLRAIDGFSQALLEDYAERVDDIGQDYLRRLRAASQRMGDLIDNLLRLSRVSRGTLNLESVDLSDLAAQVASQLEVLGPDRQVEWAVQPHLRAVCDAQFVRLALENLLGNAFKFTAREPIARIEFGVEIEAQEPVYFVRDNGVGFDMRFADQLFAPFQRLHSANEFEGMGIGLATVQRIMHRHGGWVRAEGALDEGATIRFTLGPAHE